MRVIMGAGDKGETMEWEIFRTYRGKKWERQAVKDSRVKESK
jgi:hypothetical protein